jgi:hypothetical protein
MSDTESLDYLQSGFDPSGLTVPRLRSILVSHAINYPSGAKKPQLIEIFNEQVVPQSRRILSARSRAKRTSRGIVDAESSQDGSVDADSELMPPPPTPRPRTRRPTSKVKLEESESDTPMRSPTKRTPRASSKHARTSDTETGSEISGVTRTVRKVRKSEAPPPLKVEEDEIQLPPRRPVAEDSPFSYDNPFQSGSSPLSGAGSRSTSGERRRQTLGASTSKDPNRRKSSSTTRRRTDVPQANAGIVPPTSNTFEIAVSQLNGLKSVDDNVVEASEEFTPEEQMELVRERSQKGVNAVGPRRPKKAPSKSVGVTGPIWIVLLALLGGYATWYRQEKLAVGYCGLGRESRQLVPDKVQLPDWVAVLAEPQCEPCPQHAICYQQLQTDCDSGFVLKPHPLSLGGLVPLPPTCEPDSEKSRRVKVVADRAVEELRERRAKFECGELVDNKGAPVKSPEIVADELKKEVSMKRKKGMTESEFEDLWAGALGEIVGREEVEISTDGYVLHAL